jgi:hypothetical protein
MVLQHQLLVRQSLMTYQTNQNVTLIKNIHDHCEEEEEEDKNVLFQRVHKI